MEKMAEPTKAMKKFDEHKGSHNLAAFIVEAGQSASSTPRSI